MKRNSGATTISGDRVAPDKVVSCTAFPGNHLAGTDHRQEVDHDETIIPPKK